METFWIKLTFSVVLALAALFVLLSNKYPVRTQKWAIGTLGIVAFVWIGPIPTETIEAIGKVFLNHAATGMTRGS